MSLLDSALYVASRVAPNSSTVDPCNGMRPTALPLTVRNHPLPLTGPQALLNRGYNSGAAATLMMIVVSALPAAAAYGIVRDRETGVRRAMDLCGLSPVAYWLSAWVVDAALTLVTMCVCLGVYAAFGVAAFTSLQSNRLGATATLMALYAAAMPPQTYLLSRAFRSASSAQTSVRGALCLCLLSPLSCYNFASSCSVQVFLINVVCVGLMIVSMIMGQAAPEAGCNVDGVLRYVYRLLPGFDLGNGLYGLSFLAILPSLNANCKRFHGETITAADLEPLDAFAPSATATNIAYMVALAPACMVATLLLDLIDSRGSWLGALSRGKSDGVQQANVVPSGKSLNAERRRNEHSPLLPSHGNEPPGSGIVNGLQADAITKLYAGARTPSVSRLSLRVGTGEVVGLLGANGEDRGTTADTSPIFGTYLRLPFRCRTVGAGKTSFFRLLTGEEAPTSGTLRVCGRSIAEGGLSAGMVGFVPQTDALVDFLTVGEHAELFARLRGVDGALVGRVARAACTVVGITSFWHSPANRLSGGTRRKLSLACALAGAPPVLLLDEFTSGVDAVSRRFLWGTISGIRERLPTAVLLSSVSRCPK